MDLAELILSKHSKATTNKVIAWIDADQNRFNQLMSLVLGNNVILAQRAAWAMSYIVIENPRFIYPYLNKLLELIKKPVHPAIKRNTFRFLKEIEIPKKSLTLALDACFNAVNNPNEPTAVTCFAFYTLLKLAKQFPEIKNEILFATELHQENEASGLINTLKKVRKELAKL
jgi:hypothetical protein